MSGERSGDERRFSWLGLALLLVALAAAAGAGALAASRAAAWPLVAAIAAAAAGAAWLRVRSLWQGVGRLTLSEADLRRRLREAERPGAREQQAPTDQALAFDLLSRTVAAARIGTWDCDLATGEITWSDNFEQVLGVPGRVGRSLEGLLAVVAPEDHALIRGAIEKALRDPSRDDLDPVEFRVGLAPPYRWVEGCGRLFRDAKGRPARVMGTVMDVTRRRAADEEVRRASAAKSTFLASMSHEMRTPLNGVIGMVELLGQTRVTEQQRGFLALLGKSAESLLALVNEVLDISKIEAGGLELEEIAFDVRQLARDALAVVGQQAQRKGLALSCRLDPGLPAAAQGDPGRLRQVLLNLLSNAVKFTASGEVELAVDHLAGQGSLRFSVRDTGVGIAPDRQRAIFEPFAQADASTSRTHGGTGLGLTIASRLVERMGGRLTVTSEPGKGSTFAFAVPLRAAALEPAAEPPPPPPPEAHARVLLAEDNTVNQQVLTLLLEKAGYHVEVASNGREALAALEREPFDLVLMDVQMPEMDGLRATRLIRQREKAFGGHVPVVAVTANAVQGERQRCLAAGMDDYLSKPVRGAELFAAIKRLLGERARPGEAGAAGPPEGEPAWVAPLVAMGFDPPAVAKLARTFLDTVPPRLAALRQSLTSGEAEEVRQTAHSLKGSLAVFAARGAIESARQLEQAGAKRSLDEAEPLLGELAEQVEPLLASMRGYLGE
jgi:signal transduction histidine kinase/CheY-like chemotaxis protein/HPt (histidine-containing phosphotransfer) domain-containing protein